MIWVLWVLLLLFERLAHFLGQGLSGCHVLFCQPAAVLFLALLHGNGLSLTRVLPPLFCGDQVACVSFKIASATPELCDATTPEMA